MPELSLTIDFGGGAELLVQNKVSTVNNKNLNLNLPCKERDLSHVFVYIISILNTKVKRHEVLLDTNSLSATTNHNQWTLGHLLGWIRDNLLTPDRPELFLNDKNESDVTKLDVRPGILVLVNDADWELVGQTEYILENGDNVTFISTLHGG